jgi:hypothetical protein
MTGWHFMGVKPASVSAGSCRLNDDPASSRNRSTRHPPGTPQSRPGPSSETATPNLRGPRPIGFNSNAFQTEESVRRVRGPGGTCNPRMERKPQRTLHEPRELRLRVGNSQPRQKPANKAPPLPGFVPLQRANVVAGHGNAQSSTSSDGCRGRSPICRPLAERNEVWGRRRLVGWIVPLLSIANTKPEPPDLVSRLRAFA